MPLFQIEHTWDGQLISMDESVTIEMKHSVGGIDLHIEAPFHNDPPPIAPIGSTWELWNHEVVEAFFVAEDGRYTEFEFSPHGHYLVLSLDGPRSIIQSDQLLHFSAQILDQRWSGHATIPHSLLFGDIKGYNFFAIHGRKDSRRFLCYSPLPGKKPDFHQPHRFPTFKRASL
jgi:hypothetical protein